MSRINLLPWREEQKRESKIEFAVVGLIVLVFSVVIALAVHGGITLMKTHQKRRNAEIRSEINILETKIKQIAELKTTQEEIKKRINSISTLQKDRPRSVMLFNEIIKTLPTDLYLKTLKQEGADKKHFIVVDGVALSNRRVSEYMERLEASDFFGKPVLKYIKGESMKVGSGRDSQTIKVSAFNIRVDIPAKEEAEPKENNKRGG